MKIALLALIALAVTGCASITGAVAPRVAKAVNAYCAEPLAERQLIRGQVNGMLQGNTVKVTCVGDPELVRGARGHSAALLRSGPP